MICFKFNRSTTCRSLGAKWVILTTTTTDITVFSEYLSSLLLFHCYFSLPFNRAILASDNTNTYICYIYPDAEYTGNPNGGLDWSASDDFGGVGGVESRFQSSLVGFFAENYSYLIPDSGTDRIRGIDGVRKCFSLFSTVSSLLM